MTCALIHFRLLSISLIFAAPSRSPIENSAAATKMYNYCEIEEYNYEIGKRLLEENGGGASLMGFLRKLWSVLGRIGRLLFSSKWENVEDMEDLTQITSLDEDESSPQELHLASQKSSFPGTLNMQSANANAEKNADDQLLELYYAWQNLPIVVKLLSSPLLVFYAWVKLDSIAWAIWKYPRLPSQAYEEETLPSTYDFFQMKQVHNSSDDESAFQYGTPQRDTYTPYRPLSRHPTDEPWY